MRGFGGRSFGFARGGNYFFQFLQAGRFTGEFGQIIEFGSSDFTDLQYFNAVHAGGVNRENAFHAYAKGNFAYRESFADAASSAGDDDTVKGLESLIVAFYDFYFHSDRIAGFENRYIGFEIVFNFVDIHKTYFLRIFFFWTFFGF